MIRVGDTILNEDFIAAIRPAHEKRPTKNNNERTVLIVSLSSGYEIAVDASMSEAVRALVKAECLEPMPSGSQTAFSAEELGELKTRFEQGFRFAAKDEDGKAFVFTVKPTKGAASWINDDSISVIRRLRNSFNALSFEDESPLDISILLDRLGVEA